MSRASTTVCPRCSTLLEPDAKFCGTCGARLEAPSPQPADAAPVSTALTLPAKPPGPNPPAPQKPRSASPAAGVMSAVAATVPAVRPGRTPPSLDKMIGRTLNGRYLVESKVGEGGFGAVFKGTQIGTSRQVALKILHPHNVTDQTVVARFRREAEACSKLRDPHTVTTYDFDETEDGILYMAMELLHGKSLHHIQRTEAPLAPDRVLRIIDQVAQSLGEAHQHGIVHRDMKPENVVVETSGGQDHVKVLDFGIAKITAGDRDKPTPALTAVGQTLGTLEFMSPEQLRGQAIDGRSDIYALGIMAYEMLTGQLPFQNAKSPTQVINFHLQEPAPPPSKLRPELKIPSYVDGVILKMVGKSRDSRHEDAAALREHIRRALAGADTRDNRFEAFRFAGVIGAVAAVLALLLYLSR